MRKQPIIFAILITMLCAMFLSCEGMATLFHGPKPEAPPVVYTVTFNANGAIGTSPAAQTVNSGTAIRLPDKENLTYVGNIFVGWSESSGGTSTVYSVGASVTVTADMVFYAQWLDSSTPQYTVTFNANGATSGSPPSSQTVYHNSSITIPAQGTLSLSGKKFDGWNTQTNGGGTNYAVGATYTVTGNVTLYAKWQSEVQYTVTYHANGASGTAPAAQSVDPGTVITLPGVGSMTYTGRTFDGWNTNAGGTGTGYAEGTTYTVNANVSLYAQWNTAPIIPVGNTLAEQLSYIAGRADDGINYDIVINQDTYVTPQMISTMGRNVTINMYSASSGDIKTLYLDSNGSMFTISNNITLALKDIKLVGRLLNTTVLVKVSRGGTMIIESGVIITQNTNNTGISADSTFEGGGVHIDAGTLIMNGGSITRNTVESDGGGVLIVNGGFFTMNGGIISNNTCLYQGAGVAVYSGTFTMHGGVISGNKQVPGGSGNWVFGGGGVYIGTEGTVNGIFTKTSAPGSRTSGVIYGAVGPVDLINTVSNRTDGGGDAILAWGIKKHRDTTLGEYDEISTLNTTVGWD